MVVNRLKVHPFQSYGFNRQPAPLHLGLAIAYASGDACDALDGNRVVGEISWGSPFSSGDGSDDNVDRGGERASGAVTGAAHCDVHYLAKSDAGVPRRRIGVKTLELVHGVDAEDHRGEGADEFFAQSRHSLALEEDQDPPEGAAVLLLVHALNDEMEDYPDYELRATVEDAELLPGRAVQA